MKTVLISGSGRGLGKATAEVYHKAGFFVIVTDVNEELLNTYPKTKNYLTVSMDVSSEESVKECYKLVSLKIEQLDVLVSNAGIFDFYPVSEAGSEKLNRIIDINVLGLANLSKYFLPLLEKNSGRVVVVSSESYKVPSPFQPYSVSKQMLESIFKAISVELSVKQIKCVLVRPGAIQTQILDDTIHYSDLNSTKRYKDEFRNFVKSVPKFIGKVATTKQVANLILKAGISKRPKPVYSINHNPLVTLLSFLPDRMKRYFILKSIE